MIGIKEIVIRQISFASNSNSILDEVIYNCFVIKITGINSYSTIYNSSDKESYRYLSFEGLIYKFFWLNIEF